MILEAKNESKQENIMLKYNFTSRNENTSPIQELSSLSNNNDDFSKISEA